MEITGLHHCQVWGIVHGIASFFIWFAVVVVAVGGSDGGGEFFLVFLVVLFCF